MVWVAALRVVALVTDEKAVCRAFECLIGGSVRVGELAFVLEAAVAAVVHDPLPFPASSLCEQHPTNQEPLDRGHGAVHQEIEESIFLCSLVEVSEVYHPWIMPLIMPRY